MSTLSKYMDDLNSNKVKNLGLNFVYKDRKYRLNVSPTRELLSVNTNDTRWKITLYFPPNDTISGLELERILYYHLIDLINNIWGTLECIDLKLEKLHTVYFCDGDKVFIRLDIRFPNLPRPLSIIVDNSGFGITITSRIDLSNCTNISPPPRVSRIIHIWCRIM